MALLNTNIKGVAEKYQNFILKDLKYRTFTSSKDINLALQEKAFDGGFSESIAKLKTNEDVDVFYKKSTISNQHSLDLTEKIDSYSAKNFNVVSDDGYEVKYRTLSWYFQNIFRSKNVINHFLNPEHDGGIVENAANSFYSGFACGLEKNVLLLAPAKYKAPLDYHDIMVQYADSADLIESVSSWLNLNLIKPSNAQVEETPDRETNLLKLGIGCDIAEDEKNELLKYFIVTSSYERARSQAKSIVVGSKGSGKSAIFIKLLKEFDDRNTFLISIKPDSDDLIEDVKKTKLFNSASKTTFCVFIWKVLVFSKILLLLYEEVKAKPIHSKSSKEESELIDFYERNQSLINKNFFGIAYEICSQTENPNFVEEVNGKYYAPLIKIIKSYFSKNEYGFMKIVILADGLDKTWDAKNDLDIQAEMLLSLLEVESKVNNELNDKKNRIEIKQIIFIRKDIYEYMYKKSPEKDKLITNKHEIDWNAHSNLLRKLVESRFSTILDLKSETDVKKVWSDYFFFGKNNEPFDVIDSIIEKRPRDIIYFVMMLFEAAFDRSKTRVEIDELKYAVKNYCEYLLGYLITENTSEHPFINTFVEEIKGLKEKSFDSDAIYKIGKRLNLPLGEIDELIVLLLGNEYLEYLDPETGKIDTDINGFFELRKRKKFFIFKTKVLISLDARLRKIESRIAGLQNDPGLGSPSLKLWR